MMLNKLKTYWRLGLLNLLRVVGYQVKLKSTLLTRIMPPQAPVSGVFFELDRLPPIVLSDEVKDHLHRSSCLLFGHVVMGLDSHPNWHRSILNGRVLNNPDKHWTQLSDFDSGVGDIKGIWEPSRFTWALYFVQQYHATGNSSWLHKLNDWLNDWSEQNPANLGPNWKCAQETGLRVLHLAASSLLLKQTLPSPALSRFITIHLQRILPTLGYAIAQDNNHGTSEAAALFVGGSWLLQHQPNDRFAHKCMRKGRALLENRLARLVMDDGTFSQYSVTYHRLLLDTLNLVALWKKYLQLEDFSAHYNQKAIAASKWLLSLVDTNSGDVANIGSNDGAHILNFSLCEYRDFRPTLELSCQLFCDHSQFDDLGSQAVRQWFALTAAKPPEKLPSYQCFADGGFALLRSARSLCLLRAPKFRFRPAHADAMHLDFWLDGENILPDGGSYSYNTDAKWLNYFTGCQSHNTVEFDQRPQMPKVSRFLFSNWLNYQHLSVKEQHITCAYQDPHHTSHSREVVMQDKALTVTDRVCGIENCAVLRWRLSAKRNWQIEGTTVTDGKIRLDVRANTPLQRFAIAKGAESRYYGLKSELPVLEVEVAESTVITTIISWQ